MDGSGPNGLVAAFRGCLGSLSRWPSIAPVAHPLDARPLYSVTPTNIVQQPDVAAPQAIRHIGGGMFDLKHPLVVGLLTVGAAAIVGYFGWLSIAVMDLRAQVGPISKMSDQLNTATIDLAAIRMIIKTKHPDVDLTALWETTTFGKASESSLAAFLAEVREERRISSEALEIAKSGGFSVNAPEVALLREIGYLPPQ